MFKSKQKSDHYEWPQEKPYADPSLVKQDDIFKGTNLCRDVRIALASLVLSDQSLSANY